MTTAQWYRYMVEQELTMHEMDNNSREYIKSRAELSCTSND